MLFHLQLAQDVGVERQVRERYANEISALEEEGFELLGTLETQHSFWLTPTAMMFSGKEVTKFRAPFHLDWYHPLLVSADGQTLAYAMGMGVKFYSFLDDGSSIQTSSYNGNNAQRPSEKIEKLCVPQRLGRSVEETASIEETWLYHLAYVEQKIADNHRFTTRDMVEKFIDAHAREDGWPALLLAIGFGWMVPIIGLAAAILFFWDLLPF